jgi:hypothetical protein
MFLWILLHTRLRTVGVRPEGYNRINVLIQFRKVLIGTWKGSEMPDHLDLMEKQPIFAVSFGLQTR